MPLRNKATLCSAIIATAVGSTTRAQEDLRWSYIRRSPATVPSPRNGYAVTYDSDRGVTVLFGGQSDAGPYLGDTWEWDGTDWSLRAQVGPPPRVGTAMCFDSGRHRVVLFGGYGYESLRDTWEWNGLTWQQMDPGGPQSPVFRRGHLLEYDAAHGYVLLAGGYNNGYETNGYTWDGVAWSWNSGLSIQATTLQSCFDPSRSRVWAWGSGPGANGLIYWNGSGWNSAPQLSTPIAFVNLLFDSSQNGLYAFVNPLNSQSFVLTPQTPSWEALPGCQFNRFYSVVYDSMRHRGVAVVDQSHTVETWELVHCYANCDCSQSTPLLTANDFQCFLNRFALGDSYANCDGSMVDPVLTANDFQCFLNQFAHGCP